ncbi:MAG: ComEA family DNA-binding protein [Coriobacteriia bacterium]|nr:ComEA family DNA-binding protein [Coriobacteriia bacterium]
MSFVSRSESIASKLHLRSISLPALLGLVCIVAVLFVLCLHAVLGIVSGSAFLSDTEGIVVESPDGSLGASNDVEGAENSDVSQEGEIKKGDSQSTSKGDSEESKSAATYLFVDVQGQVKNPGMYRLAEGSRLADAIECAGGFSKKADRTSVNQAALLADGQRIIVAAKSTSADASGSAAGSAAVAGSTSAAGSGPNGSAGASTGGAGKVNINSASASELTSLPGVGDATAAKIVADRDNNGPFKRPEDIKRVSGIGDKKYEAMADMIAV